MAQCYNGLEFAKCLASKYWRLSAQIHDLNSMVIPFQDSPQSHSLTIHSPSQRKEEEGKKGQEVA